MQTITEFDILRKGQTENLTVFIRDPRTEDLVDVAGASTFTLIDIADDTTKVTKPFTEDGGIDITHPSTGVYQYSLNASTYNSEYLAAFKCLLESEVINQNVFVKSVATKYFKYAAALRMQVDKSRKSISDEIENMDRSGAEPAISYFLGSDDKHLIFFLERGVQFINAIPPYTALSVETFPFDQYGTLLIDAATISYLEAMGIFAIDTDYNYSLGGNSFVIDHFTKLSSLLTTMIARFDKTVTSFKQQYRSRGLVIFQWMPGGVRSARMLQSLPAGFWSRLLSSSFV